MGLLRRWLSGQTETPDHQSGREGAGTADQASIDAEEKALELELLRSETDRLDDLRRRQLRYSEYSWTPPAQGGDRRAEDADAERE
jgi:hypothetical protein